jgi:Ni/Fe-hydrogenase subunit HybB-like protein
MAYICVLWIEVLPSVLEGAAASRWPRVAAIGRTWGPRLAKVMPYVIALAVVLPVMHQSSLGGLMLIAESKVHPLWHTALLPGLFLVSCLSMGYGAVVALVTLLNLRWHATQDERLLARMSKVNAALLVFYVAVRLGDVAWSGKLHLVTESRFGLLFLFELLLFLAPAVMFVRRSVQRNRGRMFGAALLAVAAGSVYRVDTYLTVYRPAPGWDYFPSLGEMAVTVGMGAVGIALFVVICRLFPVVSVEERAGRRHAARHVKAAAG